MAAFASISTRATMVLGVIAVIMCAVMSGLLKEKREKEMFEAPVEKKEQPKLFMFAENQCSPACCPGQFSCSGGCVCLTKQQEAMLAARGNNSHIPDDIASPSCQ